MRQVDYELCMEKMERLDTEVKILSTKADVILSTRLDRIQQMFITLNDKVDVIIKTLQELKEDK